MRTLSIDIETYSECSLARCGVYRYAADPSFEILLFAYSADSGPVKVVDLAQGEKIPDEVVSALTDKEIIKWAFNANFERVCLSRLLGLPVGKYLPPEQWRCSMIWSAYLGLPLSLEGVGAVLKLDKQKMSEGKGLIRYFCVPCTATKSNGGRTRNLPFHDAFKWETFKNYNRRDVETEMLIQDKLRNYQVPDSVWDEWFLDQRINDLGILVDVPFAENAVRIDEAHKEKLSARMSEITEIENPNSVTQMKQWLADNGLETETLGKKTVEELLKSAPAELREPLTLRLMLSKSSVKKYTAMTNAVCPDGRARGMFAFYGANRTGRFSGKIIQLQNLPQNHIPDLRQARELVNAGDGGMLETLYGDVSDTLSQLIRTAFIPAPGKKFIVADFSAIEARVIAWYADEKWRKEVFKNGGDIYCASASQMFGVPVVKHGVNGHLRQKGKIAELALGYGGSTGALKAMGAVEMGLSEDELPDLVYAWRSSNPGIVCFWKDIDSAVKAAVKKHESTYFYGLGIECRSGMLFITLPSERTLSYVKPVIGENRFGGESVTYEGVGTAKRWERIESYGPKFVENIVQATARDILCYAMKNLDSAGYRIAAHIHDEVVIEADKDASVDEVCRIMGRTPPWAPGLLLRADGYECDYYRKD